MTSNPRSQQARRRKPLSYGIRMQYLAYMALVLVLALVLSSVSVWIYMRQNITGALVDSYAYLTEKMGLALDNLYTKSDEVTASCILDDDVQKSLLSAGLTEIERSSLSKYFAYVDLEQMEEYCYVDNHGYIYARSYSKISYQNFENSGLADLLGDSYAQTQWIWTEDTLFGNGEMALFIGRYVRSLEYSHEPGMLFFKMSDTYLTSVFDAEAGEKEVALGIMTADGDLCASQFPEDFSLEEAEFTQLLTLAQDTDTATAVITQKTKNGVLLTYQQAETGLLVFTFVPNQTLIAGLRQMLLTLWIIYLLIAALAALLILYFSRSLTEPILQISNAMSAFDGNDFSQIVQIETNTELDQIGQSYNEMLKNIEHLVTEIKEQEQHLRTSELNMLIAQINPHFLYNTLDTIYMLARLNKEETTMKMIQALSRYLHLCLSKGREMVSVADELENVKSYLEIQQIRDRNLFSYEIENHLVDKQTRMLKLILQPLVENSIRHGFRDIYEGGRILIRVKETAQQIHLEVCNNGIPIDPTMADRINHLTEVPVTEMQSFFPDYSHGYGVVNIITRLRLKYGDHIVFRYEIQPDGTHCIVRIPKEGGFSHEA